MNGGLQQECPARPKLRELQAGFPPTPCQLLSHIRRNAELAAPVLTELQHNR